MTGHDMSEYPTQFAANVEDWDPSRYLDRKESRGSAAALNSPLSKPRKTPWTWPT
ncbi:MAG: hypothetical protein R2856_12690 [Caldilineaceae bacterium]